MDMTIIKNERKLCPCCMKEHKVKTVVVKDNLTFKGLKVFYDATYMYCDVADEFYMDEAQIQENDIRMKDAYRSEQDLLTSNEIHSIRNKYGITQSDLSTLLGWGGKTITRYESHQVQNRAHDSILKKIDIDPEWFISLLKNSKDNFPEESYQKYLKNATNLFKSDKDLYLRRAIAASYAQYEGDSLLQGNTELSLDKVVDVIRYFAVHVNSLYKVKLMKLMWYADALSYKKRGYAITGLVYKALPMGAVPVAHNYIIDLKNVPCKEVDMDGNIAYYFALEGDITFPSLSKEDLEILNDVVYKLGKMSKDKIISFMHKENAYIQTPLYDVIQFKYAKELQI